MAELEKHTGKEIKARSDSFPDVPKGSIVTTLGTMACKVKTVATPRGYSLFLRCFNYCLTCGFNSLCFARLLDLSLLGPPPTLH